MDKRQYGKAIMDYTRYIQIYPGYASAYNNRGLAYWFKGQYDAAITDYTKSIELNPKSARAHHNRGLVYLDEGQYMAAIADFDRAIQLDPNYVDDAYSNKGRVLVKMGKFAEALICHNKAISMCPGNPHYFVAKGFALEKMGEEKEAEAVYREALKVGIAGYALWRKAWVIYGKALAYGRLGDKENCLKALRSSAKLLPRMKDRAKREEYLKEYWNDPDFVAIVE